MRHPGIQARLHRDLPLIVGLVTAAFVWAGQSPPAVFVDFDYLWVAGRALSHGIDPYLAVKQAMAQGTLRLPFYYPGTTAVLMTPFGLLSRRVAITVFSSIGMMLLTQSLSGWRRWIVVSPATIQALLFGQWSTWLVAAVGIPWLGFVWAAKPSIGLALFAGWPSRRAFAGGLAVLVLSLLLLPHWPAQWIETLRNTPQYKAPVQRTGGVLLLLAFLRWRHPEARMLGVLALIPHTTGLYEQIPLLLIPQTRRSFALLMALSCLATILVYRLVPYGPTNVAEGLDRGWPYFLVLVYLPALVMALSLPHEQGGGMNEEDRWE